MRTVRLFGSVGSDSGYGNAVKNFAEAFSLSGIPTSYNFPKKRLRHIKGLVNYNGKTTTDFYLHCPPYSKHISNNYKIGYFYWEADRLPNHWARSLSALDEVWVPCQLVKKACLASGYRGIIKIVPTPMRVFSVNKNIGIPSYFSNDYILSKDIYKFYSIFQWHERKGYEELLKSYLSEFTADDDVILILKVNPLNIGNYKEDQIIKDIMRVKNYLNKKAFPPIFLSKKIIPTADINALHGIGDCYVIPHHGEGWGMPIHDAMYAGNQIITTKYGGVTEYLSNSSAHLIEHSIGPVTGMNWSPLYGSYQNWAYPSVKHLSHLMRDVYKNHNKYHIKGVNARRIAKTMTIESVSKILRRELE